MRWRKSLSCLEKINNKNDHCNSKFVARLYTVNKHQNGISDTEKVQVFQGLQLQRGCQMPTSLQQHGLGSKYINFRGQMMLARNVLQRSKVPCFEKSLGSNQRVMTISRQFGHNAHSDPHLSRDFLAQLWVADRKIENARRKRIRKILRHENLAETVYDNDSYLEDPLRRYSGASVTEEKSYEQGKTVLKQPPPSQSISGLLRPTSAEEAQIAPLLARSNLLITRDIEWANLILGFEQENRYAIVDVCYPHSPVGLIREQSNVIARQLLSLRRPFVARVTDGMGNELFRVRRPFWLINSSIYVEVNGKEIGVVHKRWHLWRRVYDLYLGNKQFAMVKNPGFWHWTFTLKDINGEVLAEINRDWRGFGFEIFTDAGQYVIRFGSSDPSSKTGPANVIEDLEVVRPLTLSERAVAVALAISLDNDYFSRHSRGWGLPFVVMTE